MKKAISIISMIIVFFGISGNVCFALTESAYEPQNITIMGNVDPSAGKMISFSWKNPEAETLEKVALYDITSSSQLICDDFSSYTGSNGFVWYYLSDLNANSIYNYKLIFSFTDTADKEYYLSAKTSKPGANLTSQLDSNWRVWYNRASGKPYPPVIYEIKEEDTSAIKIISNINSFISSSVSNLYHDFSSPLTSGEKYKLSLRYKSGTGERVKIYCVNQQIDLLNTNVHEWTEASYIFTAPQSANYLRFSFSGGIENLFIDDVTLYPVDSNGDATSNVNLILNGDMESFSPGTSLPDISAQADEAKAIVSITTASDSRYTRLYQDNKLIAVMSGSSTEFSYDIEGLVNGQEYKFKAVSYNAAGAASEAEVSVVPQEPFKIETDAYSATNLMLRNITYGLNGGALTLSWRNPDALTVKKITLYDNEYNIIKSDFSTEASLPQTYTVSSLTNGEYYNYRLVIDFTDSESREYYFSGAPLNNVSANTGFGISDINWELNYNRANAETPYPPISVIFNTDTEFVKDGNVSLKIMSNLEQYSNGNYATLKYYLRDTHGETLEEGEKYRLSFSYLNMTDGSRLPLKINGTSVYNFNMGTNGWQDDYVDFTAAAENAFEITINQRQQGLYIDNFKLYKLSDASSTNILNDGSFENAYSNYIAETPELFESESGNEKVNFSYKIGTEDIRALNLYEKKEGKLLHRGIIYPPQAEGSFEIGNLINDKEYTFVLKTLSTRFAESLSGIEALVTPQPEPLIISDFTLLKDGVAVDSLSSGNYSVKVEIKNNRMGNSFKAQLLTVIYKNNGMYKAYAGTATLIPQTGSYEKAVPLTIDGINLPDLSDGKYSMKIMLWSDIEDMDSLKMFKEYK